MIFSAWFYCSLTFSDGILVSAHDDDDGDVVVAVHGQVRPDVVAAALLRELAAAKNGSAHRAAEGASAILAGRLCVQTAKMAFAGRFTFYNSISA